MSTADLDEVSQPAFACSSSDEIEIDLSSLPPAIPDGDYRAVFIRHENAVVFKTQKVFLWFRIIDPGASFGVELYRAYRAAATPIQKRRTGRPRMRRSSALVEMLYRVLGVKRRADRLKLNLLKGRVLTVRTRTVVQNHRQQPIPEALRYSVVDEVLGFETSAQESA